MLTSSTPHRRSSTPRPSRGSVFLMVLIYIMVVGTLAGILTRFSTFQRNMNARFTIHEQELATAEAAINKIIGEIIFYGTYNPTQVSGTINNLHTEIQNIAAPGIPNYTISNVSIVPDASQTHLDVQVINVPGVAHEWEGYPGRRLVYDITVQARQNGGSSDRFNHPGVRLQRRVEAISIPLYVFGIFYDNELEIFPGAEFDMYGRVHSNCKYLVPGTGTGPDNPPQYIIKPAYIGTNNNPVRYHNRMTFVGDFRVGRHPDSGQGNDFTANMVNIATGVEAQSGSYPYVMEDLNDNIGTIDSQRQDWATVALSRWNGFLRDQAHGIKELRPPIPPVVPTHDLIERANPSTDDPATAKEKFENKADIRIFRDPNNSSNIVAYDAAGNPVSLTYEYPADSGTIKSIVSESSWYDDREGATVTTIDFNIANLIEAQSVGAIDIDNGLIYMSNYDNNGSNLASIRITDGATLPNTVSGGFTVATDRPLYVNGDYNVGNGRIPALLAGDAINIQSNAWNDANNQSGASGLQTASATETNAVFMSGNVPSASSQYSGGAENYFRYNENWTSRTHTFRGSLINLWSSEHATGNWEYGGRKYTAPNRNWGWDTLLSGTVSPPGMVNVFQVNAIDWKIVAGVNP